MTRPKRQHYIPEFYLGHFVDEKGQVWTYDQAADKVWSATPDQTAVETNFYSVENDEGRYIDELEKWLAGVESDAASVYPKLLGGEIPKDQDRADFSVFLSSLLTRSPASIRSAAHVSALMLDRIATMQFADRKRFERFVDRYDADQGVVTSPEMRDAVFEFQKEKSKYTLQVSQKMGLVSFGSTDEFTKIFFNMKWSLGVSRGQHLITSDNPVTRFCPPHAKHPMFGDGGFMNKHVIVTIPLSPVVLLELTWTENETDGLTPLPRHAGRNYNRIRAARSERYLYASKFDSGIRSLGQKHKRPGIRFTIGGSGEQPEIAIRRKLDG
jgi:hypothetical protein